MNIMKKTLLLLSILTLVSISANAFVPRVVKNLTVINKSGRAIEISLTGTETDNFYYLRVPAGDRIAPVERVFEIFPDVYRSQLHYVELWDPVYGYSCGSKSQTLDLTRNVRVVVLECERNAPNNGEPPSMLKYGARGGRSRFPR